MGCIAQKFEKMSRQPMCTSTVQQVRKWKFTFINKEKEMKIKQEQKLKGHVPPRTKRFEDALLFSLLGGWFM
jgi:hypothetical protein